MHFLLVKNVARANAESVTKVILAGVEIFVVQSMQENLLQLVLTVQALCWE